LVFTTLTFHDHTTATKFSLDYTLAFVGSWRVFQEALVNWKGIKGFMILAPHDFEMEFHWIRLTALLLFFSSNFHFTSA